MRTRQRLVIKARISTVTVSVSPPHPAARWANCTLRPSSPGCDCKCQKGHCRGHKGAFMKIVYNVPSLARPPVRYDYRENPYNTADAAAVTAASNNTPPPPPFNLAGAEPCQYIQSLSLHAGRESFFDAGSRIAARKSSVAFLSTFWQFACDIEGRLLFSLHTKPQEPAPTLAHKTSQSHSRSHSHSDRRER
jgi:hypothetical protein